MTRARKFGVLAALAVLVFAAVALAQLGGKPADPPADPVSAPGIFHSPPFRVRVSGALWQARSVRDADGVEDFALVAGDLPVEVQVRAAGRARVASVDLRVDGRRGRAEAPDCGRDGCPAHVKVTLRPRLSGLAAGRHRVQIRVRRAGARVPTQVASFDVHTAATVPAVMEGEPARKEPAPGPPAGDERLAQTALDVLAAERTRPGLAGALSNSRLNVIQAGPLNARERPIGITMWVALAVPLRDVHATVPAYVPTGAATGPTYTPQSVRMHVAILRDALIDVDLSTRRVIAFEPGPRSRTLSWKPSQAPAPAGAGDED